MSNVYDVAILGSGFGGSIIAMVACRLGLRVALIERGTHPRFAIGESTSPLMNLILEQLADRYSLPRLTPLATYGKWLESYPGIMRGPKRGFTYFYHGTASSEPLCYDNSLMVAASPHEYLADTHWLRSDVDSFLAGEAQAAGAEYFDSTEPAIVSAEQDRVELVFRRNGVETHARCRLLIDATGPRGQLHRTGYVRDAGFANFPRTSTLYSHFTHVDRCEDMAEFVSNAATPYPPDSAALHHIFPGGWIWVLRFDNGVISAGAVLEDWIAREIKAEEGEAAWHRLLDRLPEVRAQFRNAVAIQPWRYAANVSYRADRAAGAGWALLPSAAAFVDPLFSSGMPLTLLGIERLGSILVTSWHSSVLWERLNEYSRITLEEADYTSAFIAGCYAAFHHFPSFVAYSMFYFSSASYAEMARRLGVSGISRYMAGDQPEFASELLNLGRQLQSEPCLENARIEDRVRSAIEPLNIAGLCDPAKCNRYGVDMNDLVVGARKLRLTPRAMQETLARAEWARVP